MAQPGDPTVQKHQLHVASALESQNLTHDNVTLYSLDPDSSGDIAHGFHGYSIRSQGEVTVPDDKKELVSAFIGGVKEAEIGGRCFNPRHGLRVVTSSNTMDFVICFECAHVSAYGFGATSYFYITSSPQQTFEKMVGRYCHNYTLWSVGAIVLIGAAVVYVRVSRARRKSTVRS